MARYLSNYDGDTVTLRVAIWPGLNVETAMRIGGIDSPERHGRCPQEKDLAEQASVALRELLEGKDLVVFVKKFDKWGRPLIVLWVGGQNVALYMLAKKLARPYDGGVRGAWCPHKDREEETSSISRSSANS